MQIGFIDRPADQLVNLVESPGFVPLALAIAFAAGAVHALKPGHGKSLAAAYLVGSEGTVRDAAWLGFSVAAMHTLSVLAVAVAWTFFSLSDLVKLEQLTAALQLMVGLLVGGFGASLLRRRLRERPHHHHHHHDHGTSRPGLVLLGTSGGLVPSASAFLVLVTGIFSGRSGLALVLVLAFGVGLATMLFAVGLAAVAGRTVMARSAASRSSIAMAARLAPVLAACVIIVVGVVIAANGVRDLATVIDA